MKLIIIISLILILSCNGASAWYDGFDYRIPITIDNAGNPALEHYQFNVSFSEGINESSIRVVNENSYSTVPHWCENETDGLCYELWFNISVGSEVNTDYYIYYGNDSISSTSDYDNTFTKKYNNSGLVLELHLDEGTGNAVTLDSSGEGNDGTLTNMNVTGNATSGWQGTDGGQWGGRSDTVFSTGDHLKFDGTNDYVDCGNDASLSISSYAKISESPDVDVHQGITTDGTYFYLFHTDFIEKTDLNWNQVTINTNVNVECGNSHIGDGSYYDGKLYVATDNYTSCTDYLPSKISIWNASDLSFIETHNISAQGHEISSLVVDGENNIIYIISYCDSTKIWKYNLTDFSYIGYISLSTTLSNLQGIAKKENYFYISNGDLYKVTSDGTVIEKIYTGINEGVDYTQNVLYGLNDLGAVETIYGLKSNLATTGYTVSFLINTSYLPSEIPEAYMRLLCTSDDKFAIFYNRAAGNLQFKLTTTEGGFPRPTVTESKLFKNQWMSIATVYNNSYAKLYINGHLKSSVERDGTCLLSSWRWHIGSPLFTSHGSIDEVRIYNRSLPENEIYRQYIRSKYAANTPTISIGYIEEIPHPFLLGAYLFYGEMSTGLTGFRDGMGGYLIWGVLFFAVSLAFALISKIKSTLIGGK